MIVTKSPASREYNCIAWAADELERWWWPDALGVDYWPEGVSREDTVEAFISAYGTLDYQVCDDGELEPGCEKVAIYLREGKPTHAARQLANGRWTSKLGRGVDVKHDSLEEVGARYGYGAPGVFLKRPRSGH